VKQVNDDTYIVPFVSSGLYAPKKKDTSFARKFQYMNYGLLALASVLSNHGIQSRLFHGAYLFPNELIQIMFREKIIPSKYPCLVSIPSYYSMPWAAEFCKLLKESCPEMKIVVGGRWVVDEGGKWIREQIPETDLVVYGIADQRIVDIIIPDKWGTIPNTDITGFENMVRFPNILPRLDFSIVYEFLKYNPCIEFSRGCKLGCYYCCEAGLGESNQKPPSEMIKELRLITAIYSEEELNVFFQSSIFNPNIHWAKEFSELYNNEGLKINWRCQTRVDCVSKGVLEYLANSGLRVIDLGLESASERQLLAMGKTKSPKQYLEKAEQFIQYASDLNIFVKLNIMLYAGETMKTVSETLKWLRRNRKYFKGISANPFYVYGHGNKGQLFLKEVLKLGATPVDIDSLENRGYTFLNLSNDIDYNTAIEICNDIQREFMNANDYFELKAFTYFPRGYSYQDFIDDVENDTGQDLPFKKN